jgi:dihydrofolate reductase
MIVTAIAAIDRTGLIGDGQSMPWHLPRDLKRFRRLTMGKPVIMGRRTFETLREPLDGRLNIVLTREKSLAASGCRLAGSINEAIRIANDHAQATGGDEIMIIGGGVVFEETAHLWDRLLLTVVVGDFSGDTYFPLDKVSGAKWRVVRREFGPPDARNAHPDWFLELRRQGPKDPTDGDFGLAAWLRGLGECGGGSGIE